MMQKQFRYGWKCAAMVALFSFMPGAGGFLAQAQGPSMLFQLAHTPVTEIEGSQAFIPGDKGGYDFLQYLPNKIGEAITFKVTLSETGNYRLQTTSYKDGKEGIYSLEIDGQEIGRKDFHEDNVWELGRFDVKPGTYQVTYRCVGKNPKSPGLGVKLGNLHFR